MSDDRILAGVALRLLSVVMLGTMAALVKLAETRGAQLGETMFFRQLFALPIVVAWLAATGSLGTIRTARLSAHLTRTIAGLIGMTATFGAIHLLPLAEATTLQFATPLFATLLGALWLREATGIHRWSAVVVGFIGILIVTQPGGNSIPLFGAMVGIASAFMIGVISVLLRQIGRTENPGATVFWFSVMSVPPLGIVWLLDMRPHDALTWVILIGVGCFGGAGQIALTASLRHAPVSVVVPMDYSSLLWATLYGWLLFDQVPRMSTWMGAPLLIGSGLYIVWREHRLRRAAASARPIIP